MALRKNLAAVAARIPSLTQPPPKTASPANAARPSRPSSAAKAPSLTPPSTASKAAGRAPAGPATKTSSRGAAGKPVGKRERIDTTPDKPAGSRYVRRDSEGQFTKDQVSVGKSLAADRRTKAKTKATTGNKDRGD